MKFTTASDNRSGSVSARAGKGEAREEDYNGVPSNRYAKIKRTLSQRDGAGAGQIEVTLETSSEFVGFRKEKYECSGLAFTSKGTITLPQDAHRAERAVVVVYRRALSGPPAEHEQLGVLAQSYAVAGVRALLEADVRAQLVVADLDLAHPRVHLG